MALQLIIDMKRALVLGRAARGNGRFVPGDSKTINVLYDLKKLGHVEKEGRYWIITEEGAAWLTSVVEAMEGRDRTHDTKEAA